MKLGKNPQAQQIFENSDWNTKFIRYVLIVLVYKYVSFIYVRTYVRPQKSVRCAVGTAVSSESAVNVIWHRAIVGETDGIASSSSLPRSLKTTERNTRFSCHSQLKHWGFNPRALAEPQVRRPVAITFLFAIAIASSGSRLWLPTLPLFFGV